MTELTQPSQSSRTEEESQAPVGRPAGRSWGNQRGDPSSQLLGRGRRGLGGSSNEHRWGSSAFPPNTPQPPSAPAEALRETLVPPDRLGSTTVTMQVWESSPPGSKSLPHPQRFGSWLFLSRGSLSAKWERDYKAQGGMRTAGEDRREHSRSGGTGTHTNPSSDAPGLLEHLPGTKGSAWRTDGPGRGTGARGLQGRAAQDQCPIFSLLRGPETGAGKQA